MASTHTRQFTEEQIIAECEKIVRDIPEYSVLPAEALRAAAINRLLASAHVSPLPTMLTSKRVLEVNEVKESTRSAAAPAAVPCPEPPWEESPRVRPPDTDMKIPAFIRGALAHVLDAVGAGRIPAWQWTFQFVRLLKAHPGIVGLTTGKAWALTRKYAPEICDGAVPEDAEAAFFDAWESVRFPAGADPLEEAFRRASSQPLRLRAGGPDRPERFAEFISLAGWLCVVRGADKVKLPVVAVAKVLGVTAETVSRYRKFAIKDGYMVEVKGYRRPGGGRGEATTFRFRVELWESLLGSVC